jgi:hypothetical protein
MPSSEAVFRAPRRICRQSKSPSSILDVLTFLGGAEVKRMEAAVEKLFAHQEKLFAHRHARPAQTAPSHIGRAKKVTDRKATDPATDPALQAREARHFPASPSKPFPCLTVHCPCITSVAQLKKKRVLFCLLTKRVLFVQVRHSDDEIRNENIAMLLRVRPPAVPVPHKHSVDQQHSPNNPPHLWVTGLPGCSGRAGVSGALAATTTTRIAAQAAQVQRQLISAGLERATTLGVVAVESRDGSGRSSDADALVRSSHLQSHLNGRGAADSGRRGAEQYTHGLAKLSHPPLSHRPPVCGQDGVGHDGGGGGCSAMDSPVAANPALPPPPWVILHGKQGHIKASTGGAELFGVGIRWLIKNHKLIVGGFDAGFSATAASRAMDESSSSSKSIEVKRGDILRSINSFDILHLKQPPNAILHPVNPSAAVSSCLLFSNLQKQATPELATEWL